MDTKIPEYLKEFQKVLMADEIVQFIARQRRIGPGGSIFAPGIVLATNKRLIIIKDVLSLHIAQDVDVIPYSTITYVKLQHSVMSSTIIIGILGFSGAHAMEEGTSMMQIPGLRYDDAMTLVRVTENMLIKAAEKKQVREQDSMETKQIEVKAEWEAICNNCKAKNPPSAKFCGSCGARLY